MSQLRVDITADGTKLARGLQQSQQNVKSWAQNIKNSIATAFSAGAITAAIRQTAENLSNMGDAGDRMGRTIEEVQMLAQVAKLAGQELSKVETILNNISNAQIDALQGNENKMAAFNSAGISRSTLNNSNELAIWQMMAGNLQNKSTPQLRAILGDIVGKRNVGAFQSTMGDMSNFTGILSNAKNNGEIISSKVAAENKLAIDQLSLSWLKLTNVLTEIFLPVLTLTINAITRLSIILIGNFKAAAAFTGGYLGMAMKDPGNLISGGGVKAMLAGLSSYGEERIKAEKALEQMSIDQKALIDRIKIAQENSSLGPGMPDERKSVRFADRDIDTGMLNGINGPNALPLYNSQIGGFGGSDVRMISSINIETRDILKQMLKVNTDVRNVLWEKRTNIEFDMLSALGVNIY